MRCLRLHRRRKIARVCLRPKRRQVLRFVTRAIVGHHALDLDTEACVVGVASYSLSRIEADNDELKAWIILSHLSQLVSKLAISALALGFLIRGGIAFGKLYHVGGVVFGEALIEAVSQYLSRAVQQPIHELCFPRGPPN